MFPVYVVRKFANGPDKPPTVESAWADPYEAKHRAAVLQEDTKVEHDHVEGVVIVAPHSALA